MKKLREKHTWIELFFMVLLVIALIAPLIITGVNHGNLINSDDSSEMVLAEILSHKNFVLQDKACIFVLGQKGYEADLFFLVSLGGKLRARCPFLITLTTDLITRPLLL